MIDALSYEVHGYGPGLVLLHGIGSRGTTTWSPVVEQLAVKYTVVLPDLPGSGDSPLPNGPMAIETITDQIVATAHAAGLSEFVVCGINVGAAIAIKTAARWPVRVRGLATVVGFAHPRVTLRLNLELWASLTAHGDVVTTSRLLTSLCFAEQYLAVLPPAAVDQIVKQFGKQLAPGTAEQIAFTLGIDVRDDLAAVNADTLVVVATDDRFAAPEHSAEIAAGIRKARLVEVPGGHAAIFEDPEPTLAALTEFLRTLAVT
ncbi:alpha/beta fold hydrolase [Kibdelosporangium aridum]|uniref:alpha/beta fold hydrolase n=1 Tax=Kibdelosporangium aridum TaxID=2030 RepID=UPI0005255157